MRTYARRTGSITMEEQEVDQVIQVEVSSNLTSDEVTTNTLTAASDDNANNLSNLNVVEQQIPEEEQVNTRTGLEEDDINDMNMNEAASEDSGMSSVDNLSAAHSAGGLAHPGMLVMPTSPISVTTASMSASDDMIENENEMLRDRVADLEKRVHDQNDEITCLRATLADCLRRINSLESNKSHTMVSNMQPPRLRRDMVDSPSRTPGRRPVSGSYSQVSGQKIWLVVIFLTISNHITILTRTSMDLLGCVRHSNMSRSTGDYP